VKTFWRPPQTPGLDPPLPLSEYTLYCKFFHRSRFESNLHLPWKNRVALKIFTVLNTLFTIQDFSATLRLPWKTQLLCIHCIEYIFYIQDFWATCACPEDWIYFLPFRIFKQLCACPEKQSVSWNFPLYWMYFLHWGYFSTLRLPWKSVPWKFSLYWIHFLPFRIFKQLRACPENTVALQSLYWIYFLHSGCLSNLRMPWNFSLNWMCFLYSGFLSSLRWNFSSPGGRSPPPNPNPRLARLQISARYCYSQKILHPWLKHNAPIQRLRKRTLVSTRNISS